MGYTTMILETDVTFLDVLYWPFIDLLFQWPLLLTVRLIYSHIIPQKKKKKPLTYNRAMWSKAMKLKHPLVKLI